MRSKLFVALAFILIAFSACTHTVKHALQPKYQESLPEKNELTILKPAIKFVQGAFEDKSSSKTMLASFKQGIHTYEVVGERPMGEALFEGLEHLMKSSGHEWNKDGPGDVKVNVDFLNMQASRNAGFIKVGATSSIQIKVEFVDVKTDDMIYSQIYNGTDTRDQAMIGLMGMVKSSIDASIINCINSVGEDKKLAEALKK